jgi:glucan 1,3-beta-glucosidase
MGQYGSSIYAVTIGSEMLYRGDFDGNDLLQKMKAAKAQLGGLRIGTADSWNKYADGTADPVISSGIADLLLVNAFGFWQGQPITNATNQFFDDIMQAFQHVQQLTGSTDSIELWVGETGWPTTGGTNYQQAIASTSNAKTYYQQGVCGMLAWGVNTFFFEAYDEPWKPDSIGDSGNAADEKHWGAMTADRQPKYSLRC